VLFARLSRRQCYSDLVSVVSRFHAISIKKALAVIMEKYGAFRDKGELQPS